MNPTFDTPRWFGLWPGLIVALLLTVLIVGSLAAVGSASRPFSVAATLFDPYFLQVVQFTVWQATLSTLISVILAIPVARAYARRPVFIGRGILITLMGLPSGVRPCDGYCEDDANQR